MLKGSLLAVKSDKLSYRICLQVKKTFELSAVYSGIRLRNYFYCSPPRVVGSFFNFFLKNGPILALFVYICYFLITISIIQLEKSIDGVLGI